MIDHLLKEKNCRIIEGTNGWKDAIHESLRPLIEDGDCTEEYVQAVYDSTEQHGPYYVLTDNMALIHATNKVGVSRTQMAVTVVKNPVRFTEDGPDVRILIALAAVDSDSHIEGMTAVMGLFGDEDHSDEILAAPDGKTIYELFDRYSIDTE